MAWDATQGTVTDSRGDKLLREDARERCARAARVLRGSQSVRLSGISPLTRPRLTISFAGIAA